MKARYLWIWNFQGVGGAKWKNHGNSRGGGSNVKPSEMENPGGWGVKLEKTLHGGVWMFSGTTHLTNIIL